MNINWLTIPTLAVALLLFMVGQRSMRHCNSKRSKLTVSLLWFLLGVPGFLFPLYYLHWFDDALWFYQFRSLPFSELTAAGSGLFAGALSEWIQGSKQTTTYLIIILILGIMAPHLKPVIDTLPASSFSDRWSEEVCLQSTFSSCGAASTATILKALGHSVKEQDIAQECYTTRGGTENWYLARAFRRRGYSVKYRIEKELPSDLHTPAIAGVRIAGAGHYIVILNKGNGMYITGDPLVGQESIPLDKIKSRFHFTGFFMEIKQGNSSDNKPEQLIDG